MTDLTHALPWYWEMQQHGSGPNYYLALEFDSKQAEGQPTSHGTPLEPHQIAPLALEASQQPLTPPGLTSPVPSTFAQWVAPILSTYYDCHSANAPSSSQWISQQRSDWFYTTIDLETHGLVITYTWGSEMACDAEFIQTTLASTPFPLVQWHAFSGGDGYAHQYFRSGSDLASFFAYCQGKVQSPPVPEILQQLQQSLAASGLGHKYTLGEPKLKPGKLTVPVLYDVPFQDGGWQAYPASSELALVAQEVNAQCGVIAMASAASLHQPDDFYRIIGGAFYFELRQQ